MQLHELKPNTKRKKKKLVGRGGKRGTTSGRGTKGQKARAGRKMRPEMRDILKRIPKKRGYKFSSPRKIKPETINLDKIAKFFPEGGKITPAVLVESGALKSLKGKLPKVKILGTGNIAKKIEISDCEVSKSALEKIEKAGGSVK